MRLLVLLSLLSLNACLIVRVAPWRGGEAVKRRDLPKLKNYQGDRVWSFFAPDSIPSIDEPRFIAGDEASFMAADETILGVIHQGVAKAYSLWHLDRHEIVNDWFGETPLAVTW